jgi:DNA gyrase inhibitor GyrI
MEKSRRTSPGRNSPPSRRHTASSKTWTNTAFPALEAEGEVEIKAFSGGLYAVARCQVGGRPYETIPATWQQLVRWREESSYKSASHQWLEEPIRLDEFPGGDWDLDLYLPIAEE